MEFPILTLGTLSIAGFRWSGRVIRPILSTVAVVAIGATVVAESAGRAKEVARARTLYGCWRVTREPGTQHYSLINNTTTHAEEDRANPHAGTTYYGPETGFGKWMEAMKQTHAALDIGVVGLGAGTLNRWLRPGDSITYFEIDAKAEELARAWFTYLRRDRCAVVIGDGRKSLQQRAGPGFDMIVLDAFTGDAIPAHLLTREAGAIYGRLLKPGGLLAVHITNGHVELLPVAGDWPAAWAWVASMTKMASSNGPSCGPAWPRPPAAFSNGPMNATASFPCSGAARASKAPFQAIGDDF